VIFISGLDEAVGKVKGFAAGGVDYIAKPYQGEEVLARVEAHITLSRLQNQIEAQNILLQQEINKSKRAEEALRRAHDELEERVTTRTAELARANERLAASETSLVVSNPPLGQGLATTGRHRKEHEHEENELVVDGTPGMEGARCPP
jgi:DNA-binding response OmpR family regulator